MMANSAQYKLKLWIFNSEDPNLPGIYLPAGVNKLPPFGKLRTALASQITKAPTKTKMTATILILNYFDKISHSQAMNCLYIMDKEKKKL